MATEEELTKAPSLRDNDYLRDLLIQTMGEPELDEDNETTPLNNTSAIILGSFDSDRCLFTGDAGVQALDDARFRWNFSELSWLDVPDHGSRRNLSSDLVEYLSPNLSYISAAGDDKHPHKSVVNALKKKGTVYSTHNNAGLWHHKENIPDRSGWSWLTPL